MANLDLNIYIKKSHLKAVEKFNDELNAWAKETGEAEATLYEDANTSFTLSGLYVEHGYLKFKYDGHDDKERMVYLDEEDGTYYEDDLDGIISWIQFWRKCLKRAKRYWAMDPDRLDKIQDGDVEDTEDEEV